MSRLCVPFFFLPSSVPIEAIKEIRTGADARYYREQFQLSHDCESRWLTLTYIVDGDYKTLHAIAPTPDVFRMWESTLRRLYDVRKALMSGLGNIEMREEVWARQYWSGADEEKDERLDFDDVERMCRRLNINSPKEELMRLFKVRVLFSFSFLWIALSFFFLFSIVSSPFLGLRRKRTRRTKAHSSLPASSASSSS